MSRLLLSVRLLSCVSTCALLACGDAQDLSVGELRCEGVSCAPIDVVPIQPVQADIEDIEGDAELVPVIGRDPFCYVPTLSNAGEEGAESAPYCAGEKLISIGEGQLVVATKFVIELDAERATSGLRLALYAGEELQWESTELSRELTLVANYFGDAFAVAPGAVPGEMIVGMTRETGAPSAYGQVFYALKSGGELVELFEDGSAGRIRSMTMLGQDIVVASDYDLRTELTRYTTGGEIVWRQTTLTLGAELDSFIETHGRDVDVRVLDGQRILMLVPRTSSYQLIELTAQGELVRSWIHEGRFLAQSLGARIALGTSGQFVVGIDGYKIDRGSLVGGAPRLDSFTKERSQYWEPRVLGLHVDRAGYIYIATIDGDLGRPYGLIDRISPDLSRRESFVIAGADLAPEGLSLIVGGDLFVTDDQRTLHFAAGGTLGSMELPPIED